MNDQQRTEFGQLVRAYSQAYDGGKRAELYGVCQQAIDRFPCSRWAKSCRIVLETRPSDQSGTPRPVLAVRSRNG